ELVRDLNASLSRTFPGVDWSISQIIRDNVMEALSGVKGENSIKLFGPDLESLELLAFRVKARLHDIPGVENAGVFRIQGQSNLEFRVDRQKCANWNVSASDIQGIVEASAGGKAISQIQEGEKVFPLALRLPLQYRADESSLLAIPVPVGNVVSQGGPPAMPSTPVSGAALGFSPTGTSLPNAAQTGSAYNAATPSIAAPNRRLSDLVTPLNERGQPDPNGSFLRPGASTIYREQGQRLIAVKFEVRGRDLASTVNEAREKIDPMLAMPYRAEWSGEFKQMEAAETRIAEMFAVSLVLIALLLYLAFHSFLDAAVVFANVAAMIVGGVWALKIVGLNFNISAGVGFISVIGVAVMNGLLLVSAFNRLRAQGIGLDQALELGFSQ